MGEKETARTASQGGYITEPDIDLNADERAAGGGAEGRVLPETNNPAGPGEPAEATNLNSSKSNIYREAGPGGGDAGAPEAAINTSHSNIKNL